MVRAVEILIKDMNIRVLWHVDPLFQLLFQICLAIITWYLTKNDALETH